jgi:hypothetical protein
MNFESIKAKIYVGSDELSVKINKEQGSDYPIFKLRAVTGKFIVIADQNGEPNEHIKLISQCDSAMGSGDWVEYYKANKGKYVELGGAKSNSWYTDLTIVHFHLKSMVIFIMNNRSDNLSNEELLESTGKFVKKLPETAFTKDSRFGSTGGILELDSIHTIN